MCPCFGFSFLWCMVFILCVTEFSAKLRDRCIWKISSEQIKCASNRDVDPSLSGLIQCFQILQAAYTAGVGDGEFVELTEDRD